ncbi:SLAP domain-containing protein [Virgibacillus necropolis]|uniref:SLAP domain-containing protein n=1 Tax=Virgibacillus necropolis TaxID=163877 RepID=UPI00384D42A8
MQKLIFHPAWDKTIANQDRERIKKSFETTSLDPDKNVQFTSLSQAKNHRGDLLVMVLIHNTSHQELEFKNQPLIYKINDNQIAEHTFTLPVTLKQETSLPWTFIFPAGIFNDTEPYQDGVLIMQL